MDRIVPEISTEGLPDDEVGELYVTLRALEVACRVCSRSFKEAIVGDKFQVLEMINGPEKGFWADYVREMMAAGGTGIILGNNGRRRPRLSDPLPQGFPKNSSTLMKPSERVAVCRRLIQAPESRQYSEGISTGNSGQAPRSIGCLTTSTIISVSWSRPCRMVGRLWVGPRTTTRLYIRLVHHTFLMTGGSLYEARLMVMRQYCFDSPDKRERSKLDPASTGMTPLYRLVEDESQRRLLLAIDLKGFFVECSESKSDVVTFVGSSLGVDDLAPTLEDIEVQVLDIHAEVIGRYYIGRGEVRDLHNSSWLSDAVDVDISFLGYSLPYPQAGRIWRRWALGPPQQLGEWKGCDPELHASWLHVVQEAWFSAGHSAMRYGDQIYSPISGDDLTSMDSFYCALGEAVNGAGGYFGSNLNALNDCLRSSIQRASFKIVFNKYGEARKRLGGDLESAVSMLREFGVVLVLS